MYHGIQSTVVFGFCSMVDRGTRNRPLEAPRYGPEQENEEPGCRRPFYLNRRCRTGGVFILQGRPLPLFEPKVSLKVFPLSRFWSSGGFECD